MTSRRDTQDRRARADGSDWSERAPSGVDTAHAHLERAQATANSPWPAGAPRTPRVALALQRQIGNRATRRVLSREPTLPTVPEKKTWRPRATDLLTPTDRQIVRKEAVLQITTAFPVILRELDKVVASVHAQEKARAEWTAAILDIFFGLECPALAKLLAARGGVVAKLGKAASEASKTTNTAKHAAAAAKAAEAAAKLEPAIASAAKARTAADELATAKRAAEAAAKARNSAALTEAAIKARKDWAKAKRIGSDAERDVAYFEAAAKKAADDAKLPPTELIGDVELIKEGMKGAGKAISTEVKQNIGALFGEDDLDQFASGLATQLQQAFNEVGRAIIEDEENHPGDPGDNYADHELLAIWAAYNEHVANPATYRAALKQLFDDFVTFVRPIGVKRETESRTGGAPAGRDEQPNRAVWVQSTAGRRLWLVKDEFRDGERLPTFVGVVPDARVSAEVARDIQRRGEAPETVDESLLRTLQQTGQAPAGDPPVAPTRSGSRLPPDPRPALREVPISRSCPRRHRFTWRSCRPRSTTP